MPNDVTPPTADPATKRRKRKSGKPGARSPAAPPAGKRKQEPHRVLTPTRILAGPRYLLTGLTGTIEDYNPGNTPPAKDEPKHLKPIYDRPGKHWDTCEGAYSPVRLKELRAELRNPRKRDGAIAWLIKNPKYAHAPDIPSLVWAAALAVPDAKKVRDRYLERLRVLARMYEKTPAAILLAIAKVSLGRSRRAREFAKDIVQDYVLGVSDIKAPATNGSGSRGGSGRVGVRFEPFNYFRFESYADDRAKYYLRRQNIRLHKPELVSVPPSPESPPGPEVSIHGEPSYQLGGLVDVVRVTICKGGAFEENRDTEARFTATVDDELATPAEGTKLTSVASVSGTRLMLRFPGGTYVNGQKIEWRVEWKSLEEVGSKVPSQGDGSRPSPDLWREQLVELGAVAAMAEDSAQVFAVKILATLLCTDDSEKDEQARNAALVELGAPDVLAPAVVDLRRRFREVVELGRLETALGPQRRRRTRKDDGVVPAIRKDEWKPAFEAAARKIVAHAGRALNHSGLHAQEAAIPLRLETATTIRFALHVFSIMKLKAEHAGALILLELLGVSPKQVAERLPLTKGNVDGISSRFHNQKFPDAVSAYEGRTEIQRNDTNNHEEEP